MQERSIQGHFRALADATLQIFDRVGGSTISVASISPLSPWGKTSIDGRIFTAYHFRLDFAPGDRIPLVGELERQSRGS